MLPKWCSVLVLTVTGLLVGSYAEEAKPLVEAPDAMDFSYQQLWRYAQQQCETKGIAPSEFTSSWLSVRRCLKEKLDVVQLNVDAMMMDIDNQQIILGRHCPKLFEGIKCFDPFVSMVKGCVNADSFEIFQALRHWFQDILEYLCESNGANITYDKQKHDNCTHEINKYIITCAAEHIIATPQLDRKSLSEENCNALATAKDCLLGKLKDCIVFANGARLFYENFIQITSCKNYIPKAP